MIYLDHAATTPCCDEALQAMLPYLRNQYANASSSYAAARETRRAIECARAQTASLIGASAQDIYMTSGGTEADNWALFGVMRSMTTEKRHLIVSSIEHRAILKASQALEREGFPVTYLPVNRDGVVESGRLAEAIRSDTALVSVMLANNEVGTIQPIRELTEIAHRHGCLFHTDAVQAAGHIPVDVGKLNVDLLSLSAHKFYGPKGVGALYIRKGTKINRLVFGGEQERGLRAGTENTAGIVGMGKAAELAAGTLKRDMAAILELREFMTALLMESCHSVRVNGLGAARLPGHVHVTIDQADSTLLLMQLDMHGIAASSGSACASGITERSHVMKAMGICGSEQADIRFTLGRDNTREEIIRTIEVLKGILNQ